VRVNKVLRAICGFGREAVIIKPEVLPTPRGQRGGSTPGWRTPIVRGRGVSSEGVR